MAAGDARPIPRKNVAFRVTFPILDADGDLVTGATGLDTELSRDGGTFSDATNEATEIATSSGIYYLDLTAGEMNYDTVAIIVKTTSSGAKTTVLVLYPEESGDTRIDTSLTADAVWDEARSGHTTAGTFGEVATTGDLADGIWDEALSGHTTAGTAGKALADSGAAGDPWSTALPGAYGAGTAGKLIGDNINAPIATVDTVVDSIKVDTAAILVDTGTTLDARIPAALVSGRMDVSVGAMAANVLTASALAADAVDEILDEVVEGTLTVRTMLRALLAFAANKASGGGTTTISFRDLADSKNRIVMTVDASGNRSAVTLDLT